MTPSLYDKRGIPIMPGDVVKVFHYIAKLRKEKRYMYKFVLSIEHIGNRSLLKLSHLNLKDQYYYLLMDGGTLNDYEIVQGYAGVEPGNDFRNRQKNH